MDIGGKLLSYISQVPGNIVKAHQSAYEQYIRSKEGEMFPQAVWKKPQQEQQDIWQDFFSRATPFATTAPGIGKLSQIPGNKIISIPKLSPKTSVWDASKVAKVERDFIKGNINPIELTFENGKYIITDGRARYYFSKLIGFDWPIRIRR